jgi:hypothetical protein
VPENILKLIVLGRKEGRKEGRRERKKRRKT